MAEAKATYALDRIDRETMIAALRGVSEGRVIDLTTELHHGMPHPDRSIMHEFMFSHYRTPGSLVSDKKPGFEGSVEVITSSLHIGTHMDGLAHVVCGGRMHGGFDVRAVYGDFGWKKNGMEHSRAIMGRGVLLDVARAKGVAFLPDLYEITPDDLAMTAASHAVELRRGDVVLIRTGWMAEKYDSDPDGYFASQPGVGPDAGLWLYERGMAVMGTDTSGTEVIPFVDVERTTHRVLLVERGVHLLEILNLEDLARADVREFLFIALPLKMTGATGSWLRPVAVV